MRNDEEKNHYGFSYDHLSRWSSYWYQIKEVMDLKPETLLEIGIGNRTVSSYLKESGIKVTTLDIDGGRQPDIIASVTGIPLPDNSVDVVLAAEILEHLPFKDFVPALKEIRRVSKSGTVISLPHWGRMFLFILKIPALPWIRLFKKFPGFKRHVSVNNGHYWEMGKCGFSPRFIRQEIKNAGFGIMKDYVVREHPYHHFFVLKKTKLNDK